MNCLIGDAPPSLPTVHDPGISQWLTTVWDLHLTNYNPQFWPGLMKPREGAGLFETLEDPATGKKFRNSSSGVLLDSQSTETGAASSTGSGVLPGQAKGSQHPYIGHAADTGTFWLQWHGTHA